MGWRKPHKYTVLVCCPLQPFSLLHRRLVIPLRERVAEGTMVMHHFESVSWEERERQNER